MFEKLFSYHQINELQNDAKSNNIVRNNYARRSDFPIVVIDDQPFHYEQNLKSNGYIVNTLFDIRSIEEIKDYSIVLCDLQGVGKYLNARGQGAFIIDEIKRSHPEKIVVAYTGGSLDEAVTIKAQQVADFFLKKDADIDDWRDRLDAIISFLSDPVAVWLRQRDALVEAEVPTLDILRLEDAYVKSIQKKSISPYQNVLSSTEISRDLRSIAQSLIASGIFRVLFN